MSTVKNLGQIKILGEGSYGIVFEGVWCEKPVAIKRIQLTHILSNQREETALQKLDHPNIVKLLHVESDPMFRYYYLELCQASLDKLFLKDGDPKKYKGPMPPDIEVLRQLAKGLEYIHKMGFIHRDIKPENVLIWLCPANGQVLMKWADFALSKLINERGTFTMSGVRGTFDWLAPELLKLLDDEETEGGESEVENRGTVKTDVFEEGLVFGYYLTDGLHPFGSPVQIAANILMKKPVNLPKIQPQYARDLIKKMLADQPEKRITSSEVVKELNRIYPTNSFRFEVKITELFKLFKPSTRATIHPSSNFLANLVQASTTTPIITEIKFDNKEILGFGGYGQVFKGEWKNNQVAVKRIHLSKVVGHKQEEITLQKLDHFNVIKLLHVESDNTFKYYALELCQASLDRLFLKDGNPKKYLGPMPPTIDVLLQLSMGLEYVHSMCLVHRDIKPQNVLIWVNPSKNGKVLMKWADFGLSKPVNHRGSYTMSEIRGTTGWLAPEILKLLESGDTREANETQIRGTVKTDVFAEGLVFGYFLLGGGHLFGSRLSIQSNIVNDNPVNLTNVMQKYAHDLIEKMLIHNPLNRISSSGVTRELLHAKKSLFS